MGRLDESEDDPAGRRLAAPALADEAEDFPPSHFEGNPVDSVNPRMLGSVVEDRRI